MLIEYHRTLIADKVRNDAFRRALEKVIQKGKTVVADIGSGTGLMGFFASRLGAADVYFYEYGNIIGLSESLAKSNKIRNGHFIHGHSANIEDPPPVDVIVSETLGNYALEEHIIASIEDAKRFLKPGGAIIPQKITQMVAPVTRAHFFNELCTWDDLGHGLDFTEAKIMGLNNLYVRTFAAEDLLRGGKAQIWDTVDFRQENSSTRGGSGTWTIEDDAVIYGFAVWWNCELVDGIELATGPLDAKTHWEQLYFPVLAPVQAKKGDRLGITISSESSYEEGTVIDWEITLKAAGQKPQIQSLSLRRGYID
jgi:protein arginine N-methyltransferase 1